MHALVVATHKVLVRVPPRLLHPHSAAACPCTGSGSCGSRTCSAGARRSFARRKAAAAVVSVRVPARSPAAPRRACPKLWCLKKRGARAKRAGWWTTKDVPFGAHETSGASSGVSRMVASTPRKCGSPFSCGLTTPSSTLSLSSVSDRCRFLPLSVGPSSPRSSVAAWRRERRERHRHASPRALARALLHAAAHRSHRSSSRQLLPLPLLQAGLAADERDLGRRRRRRRRRVRHARGGGRGRRRSPRLRETLGTTWWWARRWAVAVHAVALRSLRRPSPARPQPGDGQDAAKGSPPLQHHTNVAAAAIPRAGRASEGESVCRLLSRTLATARLNSCSARALLTTKSTWDRPM